MGVLSIRDKMNLVQGRGKHVATQNNKALELLRRMKGSSSDSPNSSTSLPKGTLKSRMVSVGAAV